MKELEYPFDSGYLLKKKRSIKRQLLSDGSVRIKKKIAVLGGSTTNDIINMLELFLLNYGIEPTFYESEYNRYWQDAVFGNEELTVRIRYRSRPIACSVKRLEDGRLLVHFQTEASAIAPGQSAVFYVGKRVVGGSFIASQRGIGMYLDN